MNQKATPKELIRTWQGSTVFNRTRPAPAGHERDNMKALKEAMEPKKAKNEQTDKDSYFSKISYEDVSEWMSSAAGIYRRDE